MPTADFGIDTFSYYYRLTPNQKSKMLVKLKVAPNFRTEISDYMNSTYTYASDLFVADGIKIWISRKNGNPWGLLIVVHPMLALGSPDRSVLYQPKKKSYTKVVETVDNLLKQMDVPCPIDQMKLYRVDTTANLIFEKDSIVDEYLRLLKRSCLLPHYKYDFFRRKEHKAKDYRAANQRSFKEYCKSAAFFSYDKTAQLEMIDAFSSALSGKYILRLEAQLRRSGMRKWVGTDTINGDNWGIIKKLGNDTQKILRWYLARLQPLHAPYIRYQDAVNQVESIKRKNTKERMLYLLRKTSDSETLTAALEKLQKKYSLSKSQCKNLLKKFEKLEVNPITLTNSSPYDCLPSIQDLL